MTKVIRKLSRREKQIKRLLDAGMKRKQIAEKLGIAPDTVGQHRHNLKIKLPTWNPTALS